MPEALRGLCDVLTCVVNQVHVVNTGGACRHTREAGQTAIQVKDKGFCCQCPSLQHILDKVYAATGAIIFVPQNDECRACGGAKATVHA